MSKIEIIGRNSTVQRRFLDPLFKSLAITYTVFKAHAVYEQDYLNQLDNPRGMNFFDGEQVISSKRLLTMNLYICCSSSELVMCAEDAQSVKGAGEKARHIWVMAEDVLLEF